MTYRLQELEEEEEEEVEATEDVEKPATASAATISEDPTSTAQEAAAHEVRRRESRRLLSTCTAVPEEVRARYSMRPDVTVSHVTHRNSTLPHIQVRLPPGERWENKLLGKNHHGMMQ